MSITIRDPYTLSHSPSLLIFFLLLPFLLRRIYIAIGRYNFSLRRGCQDAKSVMPVKDPFIGLDFLYELFFAERVERHFEIMHGRFRKFGPTWMTKRWTWEMVYTCDASNVKCMLSTSFEDFQLPELRNSAMAGLIGRGVFSSNGHFWSSARKTLRAALLQQDSESSLKKLEGYFQEFLQRIPQVADGHGDKTDLKPLFFWLTTGFATDFLMGRSSSRQDSASSLSQEREQQFIDDYQTCSTEILKRMRLGPLQPFSFNASADQARDRMYRYIDDLIDKSMRRKAEKAEKQRREGGEGKEMEEEEEDKGEHDVLSALVALSTDRELLRGHILHSLLASRDTSACLLTNLFFVLSKRPDIYAKLREEVLSVVGMEPARPKDISQMQYLKWCVKESMRLHPPIPLNIREAVTDTILPHGGAQDGKSPIFVKKGTIITYFVYSMHRDESVFGPDPEEFVPERWDGLRPGWSFLPFNGGARICVGQKFALLEAHYIVSRMAQVFEKMEALDDKPWIEHFALATTCRDGVDVRLTRTSAKEGSLRQEREGIIFRGQ